MGHLTGRNLEIWLDLYFTHFTDLGRGGRGGEIFF